MDVPLEPGRDGRVRSQWPLRSEPDEVMAARQLADACAEARTDEDRRYALAHAAAFLKANGGPADSRALIALLRLPADDDSERLLADVERRLAERAPAVVGSLLRVVEGDHPACDNAAEALDKAPVVDLAQGLIEVLQDDARDGMKRAAAAGLISLGPSAHDQLAAALDDPEAGYWITAAAGCPVDATWDELVAAIAAGGDEADQTAGGGEDPAADSEPEYGAEVDGDSEGYEDDLTGEANAPAGGIGNDDADARVEETLDDTEASDDAEEEKLDDVVDELADEPGKEVDGSDPAEAGDPGGDLERDFAAFEEDFRAFDEDLRRRPPSN